jgi:dimethylhistidine N-methyltransferase
MAAATARFSLIESHEGRDLTSFGDALLDGLRGDPKRIPCRFLYDAEGSRIFEEICELPEYYLTRAEREILEDRAGEIAEFLDGPTTLAELGSGSSTKTRVLIEALLKRHGRLRYVPIDISRSILEESARELLDRYQGLEIRAIASEYAAGLRHVRQETEHPKLIAWLGSTLGNLTRREASEFLAVVRRAMGPRDRMLIGVDLRKDAGTLEAAYDDAAGVTARFTLNLLERINRELGGHFETKRFRHRARYLEEEGRVAIHLVSTEDQTVVVEDLDLTVDFAKGEAVHVEDSFKYSPEEIEGLAASVDLHVERRWLDRSERFSLNLLATDA